MLIFFTHLWIQKHPETLRDFAVGGRGGQRLRRNERLRKTSGFRTTHVCHSERTNGTTPRDWLQRGRLFGALRQSERRFLQMGYFLEGGKVQLFTFYRPNTQRADVSACDLPVP